MDHVGISQGQLEADSISSSCQNVNEKIPSKTENPYNAERLRENEGR